jgi:hypothetical protein
MKNSIGLDAGRAAVYMYILYEIVNRYRQPDTHTHTHTDDGAREKQLKQLRALVRYKPFRSVDRV